MANTLKQWIREIASYATLTRDVIALMLTATTCYLVITRSDVPTQLATLVSLALGFYFGNKPTAPPA